MVGEVPRHPLVARFGDAAVVHLPESRWIGRVDPHAVMIAVDVLREWAEGAATVDGDRELAGDGVHAVRVLRIHAQVGVVETATQRRRVITRLAPGLAEIVATPYVPFLRFSYRVHHVGARGRHLDSNAPQQLGESAAQLLPGGAPVY